MNHRCCAASPPLLGAIPGFASTRPIALHFFPKVGHADGLGNTYAVRIQACGERAKAIIYPTALEAFFQAFRRGMPDISLQQLAVQRTSIKRRKAFFQLGYLKKD